MYASVDRFTLRELLSMAVPVPFRVKLINTAVPSKVLLTGLCKVIAGWTLSVALYVENLVTLMVRFCPSQNKLVMFPVSVLTFGIPANGRL